MTERLSMLPWLYSVIDYDSTPETYERYDKMSARDMFRSYGVSKRMYEEFIKPTLLVGLFAPPEELSAAATMSMLYFYGASCSQVLHISGFHFPVWWPSCPRNRQSSVRWVELAECAAEDPTAVTPSPGGVSACSPPSDTPHVQYPFLFGCILWMLHPVCSAMRTSAKR
jgi:hypothetical protein